VVGMDRSDAALTVARTAVYPTSAVSDLPAPLQSRYLDSAGRDALAVVERLRARVTFVTRDVMNGLPPGQYEIVVCKNMLIYFGEQARARVVESLLRALAPCGALLVARSEVAARAGAGSRQPPRGAWRLLVRTKTGRSALARAELDNSARYCLSHPALELRKYRQRQALASTGFCFGKIP